MESDKRGKKRVLPSWMQVIGSQTKICREDSKTGKVSTNSNGTSNTSSKDISSRKDEDKTGNSDIAAPVASAQVGSQCAADIISQSMPFLSFNGSIVYSHETSDCSYICEDILSSLQNNRKTVIGFDMEWPFYFNKPGQAKTSLIQMCLDKTCYLFHVSAMSGFPLMLSKLILDERLILTGLNIEADLWKLERDFDINVEPLFDRGSIVDVGKLANKKLKSSERWSLEGLCRHVLKHRLDKDFEIRCGKWDPVPLEREQQIYAAVDAYAGLKIYNVLIEK